MMCAKAPSPLKTKVTKPSSRPLSATNLGVWLRRFAWNRRWTWAIQAHDAAMISHVDLQNAITEFTKRPAPDLKDADTLSSLNLDSLALLEIIGMLEDQHGVQVDEDDLVDLTNVGDLLRVLSNAAKKN